jgi:hypothetical protein
MMFPPIDEAYARAVLESRETPERFDDAMARIDAGHVLLSTFYVGARGRGTPLHLAVSENETAYIAELLERGSDPNARFDGEPTTSPPLFVVRSVEALKMLVAKGARLDAMSGGEPYLHFCVRMTRVSSHPAWFALATAAVERGADPAQKDALGQDAATFAMTMGSRIAKQFAPILGVTRTPPDTSEPSAKSARAPKKAKSTKKANSAPAVKKAKRAKKT